MWLDSDAFVRDITLDLPSLLRRYGGEPSTSRGFEAADVTDAYFGWDAPYSLGPNAGFAVLRGEGGEGGEGGRGIGTGGSRAGRGMGTGGTAGALEMLAVWWQLYHGQYGLEHAFEQHALHWQLLHLQPFRRRITTLRLRAMQPTAKGVYPDAVVHLDHNAGTETRFECPTNQSPIQTPNPMPECPTTRVQCTHPNALCPMPSSVYSMPNSSLPNGMHYRHEDAHMDDGACRGRATLHYHDCCHYHCYYYNY